MAKKNNTSYKVGQELNNLSDTTTQTVYTRKSIGYADGYGVYTQKSGAHSPDGTETQTKITKGDGKEHDKSSSPEMMLDKHTDKFRRINGYGKAKTSNSDAYEDPTFLIFDLELLKSDSALFREDVIGSFINDYMNSVPELLERKGYWEEFTRTLFKIFPVDETDDSQYGYKRHYIEAVGGLNVLLNPIINYPEDVITFTITEDIAMTLQYLAELYNNLTYSYDTHRYLIPDNLLRFNMRMIIHDVRNMRKFDYSNSPATKGVSDNVSKFIYVLHDCQFNFMNTKNFGEEIRRGGFSAAAPSMSSGGIISMNFKSYSKIMAPLLIDNSKIIDFKEREPSDSYKTVYSSDYISDTDMTSKEEYNSYVNNINYRSISDIEYSTNSKTTNYGLQIPDINTNLRGFANSITKEITQVRDVIIKQIYEEVNQLVTQGERIVGNTLGFTIGKTNVYYSSLEEKIDRFSYMLESFLEKKVDDVMGRGTEYKTKKGNLYGDQQPQYNEKYPEGSVEPQGIYNEKYPSGDLNPDGTYNEKYPSGDVYGTEGVYNEKYPEGSVEPQGIYNEKYPSGDLNPDGTYNEKYPSGSVQPEGTYNEKYPKGDLNPDGIYNQKYPKGTVENKGTYNEKYPNGTVENKGNYNKKYPDGTVQPEGMYNEKYPSGDLNSDGTYNEKYPDGTVENKGEYHDKHPNGNIYGKTNKKLPPNDLGNVNHKKTE